MDSNLAAARACSARHGYTEAYYNPSSRVVSFTRPGVRLNYYYSTRTVGTCLEHPTQGRTQLFRRLVSHELLDTLFANPRTHTGSGYQQAHSRPVPATAPARTEEEALAGRIAELEAELAPLRAWHGELRAARLAAEEEEQQRLADLLAEEEEEQRLADLLAEEEEWAAAAAEAARRRGTMLASSLREPVASFLARSGCASDLSLALGWWEEGGMLLSVAQQRGQWGYTAGLPRALYNVFHGRAPTHPSPVYCQLSCAPAGEQPHWLVLLSSGACKSSVPQAFAEDYAAGTAQGRTLHYCAFGAPGCHYLAFTDGTSMWQGLSERHAAKILAGSVTSLSLGPRNQMFVRYRGRRCGWVDGPKDAMDKVSALMGQGYDVRQVLFGGEDGDEYIVRYS